MIVLALRGLATATVLGFAVPATAFAQLTSPARLGVSVGVGIPTGDFNYFAKTGLTVGGQWQKGLGQHLTLRINLDYSRYGIPAVLIALSDDERYFTIFGGVANLMLPFRNNAEGFYVLAGLGFYSVDNNISGSTSESHEAYNIGVGLGRGRWFAEMRYLSIMFDQPLSTLPIVVGVRF